MVVIPNVIFIILLALSTFYLTFLTSKGSLTDNRYSSLYKKLTKRGRIVFCVSLFIALILILQELSLQKSNEIKDTAIQDERIKRDSIVTRGINLGVSLNRKRLFDDISLAFSNQEFRLDTIKMKLEKMGDSVKNITNNYAQPDPVLHIEVNGISLSERKTTSDYYKIQFKSDDAGSSNFQIHSYILSEFTDGSKDLSQAYFLPKNGKIPKGGKWETGFNIPNSKQIKNMYLYLKGTYSTLDGEKTCPIDDIYEYNINEGIVLLTLTSLRNEILNKIKQIPKDSLSPLIE